MPEPTQSLYELRGNLAREQVHEGLAAIPVKLSALASAIGLSLWDGAAPGQWSPFETLCHLRDAALVYGIRFRWIAFDDNPFLPNYDENAWVQNRVDMSLDADEMILEFSANRRGLARMLGRLPDVAWARTGRHEVLGAIPLEPYVRHQLAHELAHLDQIEAALARG